MEHTKGALLTNIRLVWKGLPGANALDYYEYTKSMAVKSFIKLDPGLNLLTSSWTVDQNKLECLTPWQFFCSFADKSSGTLGGYTRVGSSLAHKNVRLGKKNNDAKVK